MVMGRVCPAVSPEVKRMSNPFRTSRIMHNSPLLNLPFISLSEDRKSEGYESRRYCAPECFDLKVSVRKSYASFFNVGDIVRFCLCGGLHIGSFFVAVGISHL